MAFLQIVNAKLITHTAAYLVFFRKGDGIYYVLVCCENVKALVFGELDFIG